MGERAGNFGESGTGGEAGQAPCEPMQVLVILHPLGQPWAVDGDEFVAPVHPDMDDLQVAAGESQQNGESGAGTSDLVGNDVVEEVSEDAGEEEEEEQEVKGEAIGPERPCGANFGHGLAMGFDDQPGECGEGRTGGNGNGERPAGRHLPT